MRLGLAIAALGAIGSASAFAPAAHRHAGAASPLARSSSSSPAAAFSPAVVRSQPAASLLRMAAAPAEAVDAAISEAGADGVALFGKSGCPFCKKAKATLRSIGVHPTVVELDIVDGGADIQKELERRTGKGTVPVVFLDGEFLGGSEEVISGVEDGTFDKVEKGEIVEMVEEERVKIVQGPDAIKAGDTMPSALVWSVFDNDPDTYVDLSRFSRGKSLLVVGLPGAFTPTWSGQQVPSYLENQDKLKEAGIDGVLIYCVNDPAVMTAWAADQGVENFEVTNPDGFVSFFADATSEFTSACGMEMTHEGPTGKGLLKRCKRFAMHVVDGVVRHVNVSEYEGDPAGDDYPEITLAPTMLKAVLAAE